mgnify:CR=1 FL=1
MYWENQPELPSDKGSNWSRGETRDIGSPPLRRYIRSVDIPDVEITSTYWIHVYNQSPTEWPPLKSRIDLCQRLTDYKILVKHIYVLDFDF